MDGPPCPSNDHPPLLYLLPLLLLLLPSRTFPSYLSSFLPSSLSSFLSLLLPLLLRVLLLLDILVDSIVQLCTYKVMPNVFNESNVSNRTYEMRIVVEVAITCFPRNTVPASWIKKPRRSRTRQGQRWVVAEEAIGGNDGADGQTVT